MEQVIKCTNDINKNAVRLCDDCDLPFCTECLRKDLMGFYYCHWCYPALFKDTSAPEYEIPIDEKGLMKIQSKIQAEVKKIDDTFKHKIEKTASKTDKLKYIYSNIFKNIMLSSIIVIIWSVLADIYYVTMIGKDSANFGFYIIWVFIIMAILSMLFSIIQISLFIYRGEEADLKIYIICSLIILFIFDSYASYNFSILHGIQRFLGNYI